MSSLMALSNLACQNPLVAGIHELKEDLEVNWCCLKTHIDVRGNKAADCFEKAGSELQIASDHMDLPPVQSNNKESSFKFKLLRTLQERGEDKIVSRNVNHILLKVFQRCAWISPLIQWAVTGHGPFPSYCKHFGIKPFGSSLPVLFIFDIDYKPESLRRVYWDTTIEGQILSEIYHQVGPKLLRGFGSQMSLEDFLKVIESYLSQVH